MYDYDRDSRWTSELSVVAAPQMHLMRSQKIQIKKKFCLFSTQKINILNVSPDGEPTLRPRAKN